jgi:hypothetical protein
MRNKSECYVAAAPGLDLILWDLDDTKEQFLANPIDAPIIGWELPPSFPGYSTPYTPQGRFDHQLGLYAVLCAADGSVFMPETGKRYASIEAWANDPEVNRMHAAANTRPYTGRPLPPYLVT